jgi:hypothetical protein
MDACMFTVLNSNAISNFYTAAKINHCGFWHHSEFYFFYDQLSLEYVIRKQLPVHQQAFSTTNLEGILQSIILLLHLAMK